MKRIIDVTVWKTGNSFVITIPKPILEKMGLKVGSKLEVILEK